MEYYQARRRELIPSFMIVGVVFQQFGWHGTPHTRTYDGRKFLDVVLVVASQVFNVNHVVFL